MGGQAVQPTGLTQYLLPLAVFVAIFAVRARRMTRTRPLRVGQLWIVPALYVLICAAALLGNPPRLLGWAALVGGLVVGAPIGWWRGKATQIDVHPENGTLQQRTSPFGMLILIGLVVAKGALRSETRGVEWATNGLFGVLIGTLVMMRVEIYLRAQRVLLAAKARVFS